MYNVYGVAAAVKKWKRRYPSINESTIRGPSINESTIRGFRKRYEAQLKTAVLRKVSPNKFSSTKVVAAAT